MSDKELIEEARRRLLDVPVLEPSDKVEMDALVARNVSTLIRRLADALEAATEKLDRAHNLIELREFEIDNLDELITELRAERDAALARIEEAAELHYRDTPSVSGDWCPEDHHKWPCPTAVALGLNEGENEK